jgi:pyridoxamine 5'-phosphate oxidase
MRNKKIPPTPSEAEYAKRAARAEHDMFAVSDPIAYFEQWLAEAVKSEPNDANAMTLATAEPGGMPDARIVLLKAVDQQGFVFYTNADSDKGEQIKLNSKAALCFHWKSLKRQVRVRGPIAKVKKQESDSYFAQRARGSQIGAWASAQSSPIISRGQLEAAVKAVETRFEGQEIVRPPNWVGWRVKPLAIEFWEDGAYRLHDRRRFTRARHGGRWQSQRLSP